ncbi:MAG: DNA gyrase subunit A [Armatimonadota bacterium]
MAEEQDIGIVEQISLQDEMEDSYGRFALSVIQARALPDARDGLKPSQRRILQAMNDDNIYPNRAHVKCASIVGETMKTYHPHGDQSIYDTLVRMGQDFNMRYPLVDPQGNFGSVDGDPAGAPRYTEARLSDIAMTMLEDLDKDTIDWQPNFDERVEEATVLPAMFPNLLANGGAGIAVAYATDIPPHNVTELCDALEAKIDNPDMEVAEIIDIMQGPDFPTGGYILGLKGIRDYYETGNGRVVMQAKAVIEPRERGKAAILVTELPYQVSKANLLKQIARLHDDGKVDGISDLRDESDRKGIRVVVELKQTANPNVVLNQLYKRTDLRTAFNVNAMVLMPAGDTLVPRLASVPELMQSYIDHRRVVVTRRTQFLLNKAEARQHIVEGLLKALDVLDEVIALIRASDSRSDARDGLQDEFGFTQRQAESILAMQLGQLTRLSRIDLEKEMKALTEEIDGYRLILSSEEEKDKVIKKELRRVKKEHGDDRRTRVIPEEANEIEMEDLIAMEDMAVTVTRDGYIKRMPLDTYRVQRRGGRGILALTKKEEDQVDDLFVCTTHHLLLFFTDQGRVYRTKAYQIPLASRTSRGSAIVNVVPLEHDENITAWLAVKNYDQGGYLVMVTEEAMVKKTELKEYDTPLRNKGLIAINLNEGDRLKWVMWTDGSKDILLATRNGKALRFDEEDVRPMSRNTTGVNAIKLVGHDELVSVTIVDKGDERDLLTVSENGLGKRTALDEYRTQGRYTQGVKTLNVTEKTGSVVGVVVVDNEDEIMCITSEGVLIRVPVENIRRTGRSAQGVKIVRLDNDNTVRAVTKVVKHAAAQPDDDEKSDS